MALTNHEIMALARKDQKGRWWRSVAILLLNFGILALFRYFPGKTPAIVGAVAAFILAGPLTQGLYSYFMENIWGNRMGIERLFWGFSWFANTVTAYVLKTIIIALWSILLIVPGVIAAISYSMTFFILADDPETPAFAALSESKAMMEGKKWKFAQLQLMFIWRYLPWVIAYGGLTIFQVWFAFHYGASDAMYRKYGIWMQLLLDFILAVGVTWAGPHYFGSMARFYEDIREPVEEPEAGAGPTVPEDA